MADNAADVAEDYRQALEDLTVNSRIEIATLTNIARENASHGFAIAEALANHIKKVPPARTLPALYVLDSVVKNVPTPYALYFGPKLYSIFMGAYTKVDNSTRRKMDEMLKTWKEPVPGSISTKPVFPLEQVRPIEHALMAARNAAYAAQQTSYQGQQQLMRGRQAAPPRDTPTPPTGRGYPPPGQQHQQQQQQQQPSYSGSNGQQRQDASQKQYQNHPASGPNAIPHRATPQPTPPIGSYPPYQQPGAGPVYGTPKSGGISIDKLKDDIQQLIVAEKAEFASDPLDTSKQTRLKALLDLQTIIHNQEMPQEQLMIIRDRVAELAVNIRPQSRPQVPATAAGPAAGSAGLTGLGLVGPYNTNANTATPPPAVSQQSTPMPPSAAAVIAAALGRPSSVSSAPPATGGVAPAPASTPGVSIDSLFGQGALAALVSGAARKSVTPQQTPTPQPLPFSQAPAAAPAPAPTPAPPVLGPAAAAAIAAALRSPPQQQGPAGPPRPASAAPAAPPSNPSALLAMLRQSGLINSGGSTPTPSSALAGLAGLPSLAGVVSGNPQLGAASLKTFRPHAVFRLYDDLGPPCSQCGRRFRTDDEGRRKKTAHMDWHFRVHQRMNDAEKRGQHRSWYVDELDWIRTREAIDTDYTHPAPDLSSASLSYDSSSYNSSSHHQHHHNPSGSQPGTFNHFQPSAPGASSSSTSTGGPSNIPYLPVPEDSAARVNGACPICQEKFEMKWLDEAQEWVWMDAVRVGGRVFHASCYREAYGAGSQPQQQQGVKRKAEEDVGGFRGKIKTEGY
ncbi:uncharacterized protein C8A04DRAFT_34975 [Dichotomopilus funicola]|uniref:CID domain-containing protein n=1 Tax=Dichotomopilus funicola TaxID=1934379 RepID=A0AAN6VAF5_9PEZI|nr:hypothetical protein C8A04DRAFT_34975 [Dichotomopilus funicola]